MQYFGYDATSKKVDAYAKKRLQEDFGPTVRYGIMVKSVAFKEKGEQLEQMTGEIKLWRTIHGIQQQNESQTGSASNEPHERFTQEVQKQIKATKNPREIEKHVQILTDWARAAPVDFLDLTFQDETGQATTLLCWAAARGYVELAGVLIQRGANLRAEGGQPKRSPLEATLYDNRLTDQWSRHYDIAFHLIEAGVECSDHLIELACENNEPEILELFLTARRGEINPEIQQKLLINAIKRGDQEIFDVLLKYGVGLDTPSHCTVALKSAVQSQRLGFTKQLVDKIQHRWGKDYTLPVDKDFQNALPPFKKLLRSLPHTGEF